MIKLKKYEGGMTTLRSPEYNYNFNRLTGEFLRWGKDIHDDPQVAPFPEIADIEISTICHGVHNTPCRWCYKSNTDKGKYMSYNTFRRILDTMPWLTQIAFGIGDIDSNPDLWGIMELCRERHIVPNITINGARMKPEYYDRLAELCGAVAVSRYPDKNVCYDAVKELTDRGMEQVNIHMLVSDESDNMCYETMQDIKEDKRLEKLNALVFLSLKQKGDRNSWSKLPNDEFYQLVTDALDDGLRIGFDSCSCHKFLEAVKDRPEFKLLSRLSEPCESTLFSIYINVDGRMYPCSFVENTYGGVDVTTITDFTKEVWNSKQAGEFRKTLLENKRRCPAYEV